MMLPAVPGHAVRSASTGRPVRSVRPVARVAITASALIIAAIAGCRQAAPVPPTAEFLVATPDSTYWVSSGAQGIHVRAVPMTITRYGGRFHEVFVADVDRSFNDAVFTGERVYVRDLVTGDSTMVYDDTAIVKLAGHHAIVHPDARPLAADDDTPDDPAVTATGETDIVEVRGPYALLEHRFSFEHIGGEQDDTVRAAVDLRTGRAATSADVAHDAPTLNDSSVLRLPRIWKRPRYTLLARGDAGGGSASLSLRDPAEHSWPLLSVPSSARVYWLDTPPLDAASRRALAHAFNEAAAYDETVSFVRLVRPVPRRPGSLYNPRT